MLLEPGEDIRSMKRAQGLSSFRRSPENPMTEFPTRPDARELVVRLGSKAERGAAWKQLVALGLMAREAVLEGHTGVIVKSRDSARLAERVLHILDNQDWSAKARQRGPAFVRERFGIERMIEETLEVYGLKAPDRRAPAHSETGQTPDG